MTDKTLTFMVMLKSIFDFKKQTEPHEFRNGLIASICSIVHKEMDEDYWNKFIDVQPCGKEGCNCHESSQIFVDAAKAIKDSYEEA